MAYRSSNGSACFIGDGLSNPITLERKVTKTLEQRTKEKEKKEEKEDRR